MFIFLRGINKYSAVVFGDLLDAFLFFVAFKNPAITYTLRSQQFDENLGLLEVLNRNRAKVRLFKT
ncbi:MAG TPA: hypothetical protein DGG95_15840 [Cytophagales bacterium]|nr:hypothetical protein [Cytophagales bacterium]